MSQSMMGRALDIVSSRLFGQNDNDALYVGARMYDSEPERIAAPTNRHGQGLYNDDRLVIILAGAFLAGLGVPYVLQIAVAALAITSMITVLQRIAQVRKQAKAANAQPA